MTTTPLGGSAVAAFVGEEVGLAAAVGEAEGGGAVTVTVAAGRELSA